MSVVRRLLPLLLVLFWGTAQADCPRIVSQSPYLTMALEWLGQGGCIVGVSRYDRRDGLPRTGGVLDPDGAAIAALKPDLVVGPNWIDPEVLKDVTPAGARSLRLDGFASMADSEAMLEQLAAASGAPAAADKVEEYRRTWRSLAARVDGRGRRVLLLSACNETPYSFGREHVLGDLFTEAGFKVVETAPKVRNLHPGEDIPDIQTLVARTRPDIVFNFAGKDERSCFAALGRIPATLVMLKGDNFFHPGPGFLEGLADLAEAMRP